MIDASRIRGFLIMKPKPAVVRITVDDQEQEVSLSRSYAKTADTIAAMEPDLIECFDAGGKLLRALRGEEARRESIEMPAALKDNPLAAAFALYANHLARAYEHATDVAFTKMVEISDVHAARAEAVEARLERVEARNRRLVEDTIETELERAEEQAANMAGGGGFEGMMERAFFAGQAQGEQQQQPPQQQQRPRTNGKPTNGSKPKAQA